MIFTVLFFSEREKKGVESKNTSPVCSLRLKYLTLHFRKTPQVRKTLENGLISKHPLKFFPIFETKQQY